jgi:archaemetzincin
MKYLYVGAAGGEESRVDPEALRTVRDRLAAQFGAPPRDIELPPLDFAWDERRGQFGSIPVMEMLLRECPDDAMKLLAVTARDLFIPVLTFVYGQAQLGGRVGVVSLARLRQEFYGLPDDREALLQRAVKEALHETGHMFGLVHCPDGTCAMSLATNIRQIDSKHAAFCGGCAARLARRPRE